MSGVAYTTLSVAVVWLGDLLSGHLHHKAATIELGRRSFSLLRFRRFSLRLGSKGPLHGTNRKITAKVRGRIRALGPNSLSRKLLLSIISVNLSLDSAESN